jgi:thiamine biosynthesis lipoprotein
MPTTTRLLVTRRRALFIGAAALVPVLGRAAQAQEAFWQGNALGAHAEIRLRHLSQPEAAPIFAAIEDELDRLEAIFSLYREDSALSRLNRDGQLDAPPPELLEVLSLAASVHAETGGLFDPTVQPLFRLYAEAGIAGRTVAPEALAETLTRVGFAGVAVDPEAVRFARSGMGLTLNGIAQGYITDRIAALLRVQGLADTLVDIGEIAALGAGPSGRGWRVAIDGGPVLTLTDQAIATSAPLGTTLDAVGRVGHILHPLEGWVPPVQTRVSVIETSAARADALSTACALMPTETLSSLARPGRQIVAA